MMYLDWSADVHKRSFPRAQNIVAAASTDDSVRLVGKTPADASVSKCMRIASAEAKTYRTCAGFAIEQ